MQTLLLEMIFSLTGEVHVYSRDNAAAAWGKGKKRDHTGKLSVLFNLENSKQ